MSFVSSIVGGIMGAKAFGKAADTESQAADKARGVAEQNQQASNKFQQDVWSGTQKAEQPYQTLGSTAANHLSTLVNNGFQQPTLADAEATPGFQFRLKEGTNAINQNAAANGTLMTGNTGRALQDYGQGLAESSYNDDFSRALSTYMSNYQSLLGATGVGQNSTAQLGQFGQAAANTTANINQAGSHDVQQQINNAAAARASGYLGKAQQWGRVAGGIASGGAAALGAG